VEESTTEALARATESTAEARGGQRTCRPQAPQGTECGSSGTSYGFFDCDGVGREVLRWRGQVCEGTRHGVVVVSKDLLLVVEVGDEAQDVTDASRELEQSTDTSTEQDTI
jgi:hypothetical protein